MTRATRLDRFKVPLTGQEIELQQLDYEGGGMSQLRIRIRERSRFTTVDVDPLTAANWAEAMRRWAQGHAPAPTEALRAPPALEGESDD